MSTAHESMIGILRLYELRSEQTMRKARDWFATGFYPESTQDILNVLVSEHSADFRMLVSYWDMAAAFVVFGAINDEMFNAINTEHVAVYAKLQPFLEELRAMPGVPPYLYLKHLEPVVLRMPDAQERVAVMRRYMESRRSPHAESGMVDSRTRPPENSDTKAATLTTPPAPLASDVSNTDDAEHLNSPTRLSDSQTGNAPPRTRKPRRKDGV